VSRRDPSGKSPENVTCWLQGHYPKALREKNRGSTAAPLGLLHSDFRNTLLMSFYFIPFDQFDYKSDFLVQGSCSCKLPNLIDAINAKKIDTLSICEMHNHANEYLDVGKCLSLEVVDGSIIKVTAIIHKPNTISKIQHSVLLGFSIKFDSQQQHITEIALIDAPTFQDEELEKFIGRVTRRRLLYFWTLRTKGFQVDDAEIKKLEGEVYPDIQELDGGIEHPLCQRDIDKLQLLLSFVEPYNNDDLFTKALVFRLQDITVRMWQENKHQRPHFHIKYRNQYNASYAIDTLERLAGKIPAKYEKPILEWAEQNREALRLTWNKLQAGENVWELISPASTA
jgi:hypothetical protein